MPYRNILAVDSSTEHLQVALQTGESTQVRSVNKGLKHTEELMPQIQSLLANEGIGPEHIEALVCARGPGSFTGLRIGMSGLKAMSFALGIPLVSVSVLDSIALHYRKTGLPVLSAIDARRQCFYIRLYDFSKVSKVLPEADMGLIIKNSALGPCRDCSLREIETLLNEKLVGNTGKQNQQKTVLLVGPHAAALKQGLGQSGQPGQHLVDLPCTPWVLTMLELGLEYLEQGHVDAPEQGPEYIRAGV